MFTDEELEEIVKGLGNYNKSDSYRITMLQYENLRKHFNELVYKVLGKNYYNMGMDVYTSDKLACEDLAKQMKKNIFQKEEVK